MPRRSQVIDYALARRALLVDVRSGRRSMADVCDAHPDLLRAAHHYGEPTDDRCPLCRARLTRVTYAYGDELQHASGRARPTRSLEVLATRYAFLRIYVVEVCRSCGWNHLTESYITGAQLYADPVPVASTRPPQDVRRRTARQ